MQKLPSSIKIEKRFDDNMIHVKPVKDIKDISCPYKVSFGCSL